MFELLKLLGGWAWIVLLITIGIIVFIILNFKKQNKQVELTEIKLPGVTAKISPIPVRRIAFITQPKDASGRPASLADIIVRIYDDNNKPLGGRQVIVELHSFSGTDYLRGILNRLSDETGTVVFSGLKISRSGQYELIAKSEGQLIISAPFEITPPGLDTNFSDKPFNSPEYKIALSRKLALSKAEDELKMDKEEI